MFEFAYLSPPYISDYFLILLKFSSHHIFPTKFEFWRIFFSHHLIARFSAFWTKIKKRRTNSNGHSYPTSNRLSLRCLGSIILRLSPHTRLRKWVLSSLQHKYVGLCCVALLKDMYIRLHTVHVSPLRPCDSNYSQIILNCVL